MVPDAVLLCDRVYCHRVIEISEFCRTRDDLKRLLALLDFLPNQFFELLWVSLARLSVHWDFDDMVDAQADDHCGAQRPLSAPDCGEANRLVFRLPSHLTHVGEVVMPPKQKRGQVLVRPISVEHAFEAIFRDVEPLADHL